MRAAKAATGRFDVTFGSVEGNSLAMSAEGALAATSENLSGMHDEQLTRCGLSIGGRKGWQMSRMGSWKDWLQSAFATSKLERPDWTLPMGLYAKPNKD